MRTPFSSFASLGLLGAITFLAVNPLVAQSTDAAKKPRVDDLTAQLNSSPSALSAAEETSKSQADPSKMVAGFFAELESNRVDAAYDKLLRGSTLAEAKDDVANLKSKTQAEIENFGAIIGYELVNTKKVGEHLVSETCISTGKFPLRWRFFFYKATDAWRVIDMRVDDRLMDMFQEPVPVVPVPTPAR